MSSEPPVGVDGFEAVKPPPDPGWDWTVYRSGTAGPPVVLLHELMGLTPEVLELGRRVVEDGFTVWLPVLAGPVPATGVVGRARAAARLCVSREIHLLARRRTSPVVARLRALTAYAAAAHGAPSAGIIGMCLTGGFALGVATDRAVAAAVASQPSLPLVTPITRGAAASYGLSQVDRTALQSRVRAGEVEVYLTRFSEDRRCPAGRELAIVDDLGPVGAGLELDVLDSSATNPYGFEARDHSVLAVAPRHHPSGAARARLDQTLGDVLAFLHRRLDPAPG